MLKASGAELGKIVDWLAGISSHGIYADTSLRLDFKKAVGIEAPYWPNHSWEVTQQTMEDRGLGGEMPPQIGEKWAYGYEIARCLAWEYAGFVSSKMGRGSSFLDHVNALRNARDLKVMI